MVLRIFKTYIYILFFLYEFKCKDSKELKEIILNKYEYELDVSEFGLTLLNLNTELYDMNYSLMAYINDTFFNEDLFNYFTPFFNHFWIFYISDIKVLNDILSKYKGKNDYMTIYGIIIPKKLMNIIPRNFNKQTPSIFYIEDNIADVLIDSDFRTNDKMVYFSFNTEKPISRYPEDYYFALTVIIFIISSIILMLWVVFYRVSKKKDITMIQKYCNIFPPLNLVLSLVLLIKYLYIRGKDPYYHYEYMQTIDTIYLSINTIFRFALMNLLIMFSTGWKIAIETISKKILLYYFKMGVLIFGILSIDILLYNISEKYYNKYFEIINLVFILLMVVLILRKINSTVKLLYKKLYYAQTLIPEFVESLLFKLTIFHRVKLILITYPITNFILFLIHIFIPDKYISVYLKFINYYFLDLLFLTLLLIVFGPRTLPKNYDVDFAKDLEDDPGKIYKLNIPLNSEGDIIFKDLRQKDIAKIKKKKLPIIIFGPSLNQNKNNFYFEPNKNIFLIKNIDEEKDMSRFFANLQIGFHE